jgi:hypothetical protein
MIKSCVTPKSDFQIADIVQYNQYDNLMDLQ